MGEAMPELRDAFHAVKAAFPELRAHDTGIGSAVYAVRPGDGSAREQAASCQRVLGGLANVAAGYATKRYRSNLINWGMLPLVCDTDHEALPFGLGDFLFLPGIRAAVESGAETVTAYVASRGMTPVELKLGALTPDERKILLAGCLINFYKGL